MFWQILLHSRRQIFCIFSVLMLKSGETDSRLHTLIYSLKRREKFSARPYWLFNPSLKKNWEFFFFKKDSQLWKYCLLQKGLYVDTINYLIKIGLDESDNTNFLKFDIKFEFLLALSIVPLLFGQILLLFFNFFSRGINSLPKDLVNNEQDNDNNNRN